MKVNDLIENQWSNFSSDDSNNHRKQLSWSHQLDILTTTLNRYEDQGTIEVSIYSYDKSQDYDNKPSNTPLHYILRIGHDIIDRYIFLLTNNPNLVSHIKNIVDRINHICDLGGRYY